MICTHFISMVALTTKTGWPENLNYRKMVLTKKNVQGNIIFLILSEKSRLFLVGVGSLPHPPPDRGYFDFFEALPKGRHT